MRKGVLAAWAVKVTLLNIIINESKNAAGSAY